MGISHSSVIQKEPFKIVFRSKTVKAFLNPWILKRFKAKHTPMQILSLCIQPDPVVLQVCCYLSVYPCNEEKKNRKLAWRDSIQNFTFLYDEFSTWRNSKSLIKVIRAFGKERHYLYQEHNTS
ncbi:hypothetical protein CEXT_614221 [Caerostris extrusa]|uniref:Uncharacterized protein n=1 Tax=Caerostris extrusa TaxID=172846 RepID=A0AAV4X175_CAEEX|nr:hypothetical protein CEXT_614221 [Caerostris extrusa]